MSTRPPALDPSLQVPDIPPSGGERALSALGGFIAGGGGADTGRLDASIQRHHEARLNEARMHRQNAATAAGILATGIDPKTGGRLSPEDEQRYTDIYNSAMEHYNKLAGVSKEHKGAIAKTKGFLDRLIGLRKQARGESPQGAAAGTQIPTGGIAPGEAEEQSEGQAPTRGAMPPPPTYDELTQMQMPELREQVETQRGISTGLRKEQAAFGEREREADEIGLKKGTREYAEFVATGRISRGGRLQRTIYTDPRDPTKTPKDGSYDPDSGQILDQEGQVVEGAQPTSLAGLTPKRFTYIGPNGEPLIGLQIGSQFQDQEGNPLPPGTQVYVRGAVPTETLRQVITTDPATGTSQINTLETIRAPFKLGARPPGAAAPTGGGGGGGGAAARPSGGQRIPISTPPPGRDVTGRPLGMAAGTYRYQTDRVTAIREASTQLLGDPTNPSLRPLSDFAHLADDPGSRERLGAALKLTFDGLEQDEKQHGSLIALLQAYGGVPQALAAAKASVQRDVIDQLTPEEQDAFDATITAFSSVVGLRSLTKASAAMFSVKALERDVPIIGVTATSARQFNDKMAHAGELAYNGIKTVSDQVMPPSEKQYYQQKLQQLRGEPQKAAPAAAAPPKAGAMKPPPKGSQTSTDDEILKAAEGLSKRKKP